jgi:diguanylate cyclase (GGDEF)-like protein
MLAQEVGPDGHGWLQGVHPQDAQRRLDTTGHAFATQLAFSVDYRLRRADGVYRWLTDHGVPRHDEQGVFLGFIGTCIDITERMEHANQLEQIAHFDSLTGLPNRTLLADRLHQALAGAQRRGQLLAVVFLDLDGFKAINDAHGHEAGDLVLVTVARRMKQVLRGVDTLARLGGDEFVAVLADLFDRQSCVPMLDRVLEAAAEPVPFGGVTLQVTASAGVTFYPQSHDVTADQLLRQADQAMYQAKLAGKNRYHFFQ